MRTVEVMYIIHGFRGVHATYALIVHVSERLQNLEQRYHIINNAKGALNEDVSIS